MDTIKGIEVTEISVPVLTQAEDDAEEVEEELSPVEAIAAAVTTALSSLYPNIIDRNQMTRKWVYKRPFGWARLFKKVIRGLNPNLLGY